MDRLPCSLLSEIFVASICEPLQVTPECSRYNKSTRALALLASLCRAFVEPARRASLSVVVPGAQLSEHLDCHPETGRHIEVVFVKSAGRHVNVRSERPLLMLTAEGRHRFYY